MQSPGGNADASRLVAVHIGQHPPGSEDEAWQLRMWENARERRRIDRDDHLRVSADIDWAAHGFTPRWLGQESSDCNVAIEPGHYAGRGAAERDRFLAGAKARGEVALVVAGIGDAGTPDPYSQSAFDQFGGSVWVRAFTIVKGIRLPAGTRPQLASDLSPVDRDLALRVLNRAGDTSAWWSLHLRGVANLRGDRWGGATTHPAEGHLDPILVDGLGDPVVAAWVSDEEDERWYIVPDGTDWDTILGWLIAEALPEFVPSALRRVRSTHFDDPALQTRRERDAHAALARLEEDYQRERADLGARLEDARSHAEEIRDGLLFGTGIRLVTAVHAVLEDCGLTVVDLDTEFEGKSADLLIIGPNAQRRLVEVKATSGMPGEDKARDLDRHLGTWTQLRPAEPVDGGVLVVNHQHRLPPTARADRPYSRPEFVASLTFPVVSTLSLFRWWAEDDHGAIVQALYPGTRPQGGPVVLAAPPGRERDPRPERWWRPRKR